MKKPRKTEPLKAADYLKMPYARLVTPDEDGTFFAEILEFPGCIATGDTREEALDSLEEVAIGWLEGMLASRQPIQPPQQQTDYSGKLLVRMPRSLHRKLATAAVRDGVSLNQYIVSAVAESFGQRSQPSAQVVIFTSESGAASPRRALTDATQY